MSSPAPSTAPAGIIRLNIQQPALPKYRVPVFAELARRPGIQPHLYFAQVPNLANMTPEGFPGTFVPMREWRVFGHPLYWHSPQWRLAHRDHSDVLLLSWNTHYLSLVPALLRARWRGVPTILWGHGYSKTETGPRTWLRRSVARLATALLFYNHRGAEQYLRAGWNPQRVHIALNSLDQTAIQPARRHWLERPAELAAFAQHNGLLPGPVLLFVSRFDPDNRVDLLLRAAAQLTPRFPHLRLVIIGKGEPEGRRLRDLTQTLALSNHVLFPGAIYEEMDLAPWFLSAHVFCYPANIGLSILHAFGYGLPVVTDNAIETQNPEIEALRDGHNGLLYQRGNVEALTQTLTRLLADPDLRRRMGQEAHRTIEQEFSIPHMVDGMEAAVRYCAGRRAAKRGHSHLFRL